MKKIFVLFMALLLAAAVVGCSSSGESDNANGNNSDEKSDNASGNNDKADKPTLTIGVTPWTSTIPPTKIAGKILEDMGYTVKEKEAQPGAIYAGMSSGDIDIFMDSWYPNQKQYIDKYSDSIESISVSYDNANSGPVVPKYMEDIKDLGDLKGKEDIVNNKMYGIGEGDPAMKNMQKVIDAYDLDIELVTASEGPMLAKAKEKIDKKEPVLFYGWRPHSMFQKFDAKILTTEEAPEGFFEGSTIHIIANKKLKEKAPEASKFLSNWSIAIDDVEKMITKIDKGKDAEKLAQKWIDNHQDKVKKMKGKK